MFPTLSAQREVISLCRTHLQPRHIRPLDCSWRPQHRETSLAVGVAYSQRRRYAAVQPRSPSASPSTEADGLPPPEPARKPKLDLRPAPKRADPSSSSSSKPVFTTTTTATAPPSSTTAPPPLPDPPIPAPPPPAPSKFRPSTIDLAISDVQHAARTGILVPPPESASFVARSWHTAKELFKFYWKGLNAIRTHGQIVRQIKERCAEEGREMGWREERFVKVYRKDQIKLVPFLLILIVLEEIIPLIVIWAPFLLPSTCILPSQRDRMEKKRLEKQLESIAQAGLALSKSDASTSLRSLSPDLVKALCGTLSLFSSAPTLLLRPGLTRYLTRLTRDDALLAPSLPSLDIHELREAVAERGGLAAGAGEEELRRWLARWVEGGKGKGKGEAEGSGMGEEERRAGMVVEYVRAQWASGSGK